jgi:hypothetical protein
MRCTGLEARVAGADREHEAHVLGVARKLRHDRDGIETLDGAVRREREGGAGRKDEQEGNGGSKQRRDHPGRASGDASGQARLDS